MEYITTDGAEVNAGVIGDIYRGTASYFDSLSTGIRYNSIESPFTNSLQTFCKMGACFRSELEK